MILESRVFFFKDTKSPNESPDRYSTKLKNLNPSKDMTERGQSFGTAGKEGLAILASHPGTGSCPQCSTFTLPVDDLGKAAKDGPSIWLHGRSWD